MLGDRMPKFSSLAPLALAIHPPFEGSADIKTRSRESVRLTLFFFCVHQIISMERCVSTINFEFPTRAHVKNLFYDELSHNLIAATRLLCPAETTYRTRFPPQIAGCHAACEKALDSESAV